MRKLLLNLLALVVALVAVARETPSAAGPLLEKIDLFEAGKEDYALYRIPGIVVTKKERLDAYPCLVAPADMKLPATLTGKTVLRADASLAARLKEILPGDAQGAVPRLACDAASGLAQLVTPRSETLYELAWNQGAKVQPFPSQRRPTLGRQIDRDAKHGHVPRCGACSRCDEKPYPRLLHDRAGSGWLPPLGPRRVAEPRSTVIERRLLDAMGGAKLAPNGPLLESVKPN